MKGDTERKIKIKNIFLLLFSIYTLCSPLFPLFYTFFLFLLSKYPFCSSFLFLLYAPPFCSPFLYILSIVEYMLLLLVVVAQACFVQSAHFLTLWLALLTPLPRLPRDSLVYLRELNIQLLYSV